MPDILTPEEIAAIAAFPEERVLRIARGVSGEAYPDYRYDPASSNAGNLVASNPRWFKRHQIVARKNGQRRSTVSGARRKLIEDRRDRVLTMVWAGIPSAEIASRIGFSVATIENDRRTLADTGKLVRREVAR